MMTTVAIAAMQVSLLTAQPQGAPTGYQSGQAAQRPVLILLGADWCPACRQMKNQTLPEVARSGGLRGVDYVYVDVDRQRKLAEKLLRGGAIPQLIRLERTDAGWSRQYLIGAQSAETIAAFAAGRPGEEPVALGGLGQSAAGVR